MEDLDFHGGLPELLKGAENHLVWLKNEKAKMGSLGQSTTTKAICDLLNEKISIIEEFIEEIKMGIQENKNLF